MPIGRPTIFKRDFVTVAAQAAINGATDMEIADLLDVDVRTIYRWKSQHSEFSQALKFGKDIADDRVERALYQRAVGFEHNAVKVSFDKDGKPLFAAYREYVVPDTTAGIFWLKNRRDKEWRDKTQQDVNLGIQVVMVSAPVEQSRERPALRPAFDEKLIEGE